MALFFVGNYLINQDFLNSLMFRFRLQSSVESEISLTYKIPFLLRSLISTLISTEIDFGTD